MRKLLILRPEPGASATATAATSLGLNPVACPLFAIEPVAWSVPDAAAFNALLLTSANAVRHAGAGLGQLAALPVVAVGETTAQAARRAGFDVRSVGGAGVEALLATLPGSQKLLHLCGEDRASVEHAHDIVTRTVYRARALPNPDLPDLSGWVVAVHSPRAGARFAELVPDRGHISIAAISAAAASACESGWERIEHAARPSDAALLALAARLCQSPPR